MPHQQKFGQADDAVHCLHNYSGSHGVPNVNLFGFKSSSAIERLQNLNASSKEKCIAGIMTVL